MTESLVKVAVFGSTPSIRVRTGRLLGGFVAVDPDNRTHQAVQTLVKPPQGATPHGDCNGINGNEETNEPRQTVEDHTRALVNLMETLAEASPAFARFALQEVLLPSAHVAGAATDFAPLPIDERNRAIIDILEGFEGLDDDTAAWMLEKLLTPRPNPATLESVRAVLAKATHECRARAFAKDDGAEAVLVKAALLSCGPNFVPRPATDAAAGHAQLLELFRSVLQQSPSTEEETSWRRVAMNGVTSLVVVCSTTAATPAAVGTGTVDTSYHTRAMDALEKQDCKAAFVVAFLWGLCLSMPNAVHAEEEESRGEGKYVQLGHRMESELKVLLTSTAPAELEAVLGYFPLVAAVNPQRGSLLYPYLALSSGSAGAAAVTAAVGDELPACCCTSSYWRGLLALLAGEDARHIRRAERALLRLLTAVEAVHGAVAEEQVRAACFLLDKKGAAGFLYAAIPTHPALLQVVCGGLDSSSMNERSAALVCLANAAAVAAGEKSVAPTHSPNPVQRKLFQDARDVVLRATLPSLADKKRLVRQAAGRCRNAWYKVK